MEREFHVVRDTCPVCGCKERFFEELGKELKERKLAREEWNLRYDVKQGIAVDPNRAALLPIGVTLPGFSIITDVCMKCQTIYAVEIRRLEGKTSVAPLPTGINLDSMRQNDPMRKN